MFDDGSDGWRAWFSWRGLLLLGFGLSLVAGLSAVWLWSSAPSAAAAVLREDQSARGNPPPVDAGVAARTVEVFVSGAVASPGMYRLAAGLRIADAIAAAGGLSPDADPDRLPDLAGRLSDGKQVKVPRLSARARSGTTTKLDVNTASAADLAALPGMDMATASAIVDYRDAYGAIASLTELRTALGLDPALVTLLRRYLRVG